MALSPSEMETNHKIQEEEPKDSYQFAYIIHCLLGAGYLLPWYAFLTAVDYFQYLYPTKHINKVITVSHMSGGVTVLLILLCWSKSFRIQLPSVRTRMNIGQGLFVLALMVAPVTDWMVHGNPTVNESNVAFAVLVSMVIVSGLANGLVGGSLVGATGELPGRYMQAVCAGNASAGLMVSILRVITKASFPHTQKGLRTSTHIYFVFSAVIIVICIICTNVLDRLPVIRHYRKRTPNKTTRHIAMGTHFWEILKKIRWFLTSALVIHIVSLSIFPGYLSENVKSDHLKDWYPIILIITFNLANFIGKCLTPIYIPRRSKVVIRCCIARVVFYPLFMGCIRGPKWMRSEIPVIVLTLMLGLSNGYLTSVIMIIAPKSVPVEESEVVGIAMETSFFIGLVVGSACDWFWNLI